jgi:DNA-directed RNA polymerase subunit M/transcription elongation factor TFIIS
MDIAFGCPQCQQHVVIDEAGAGLLVACPKCGREIRVPSPDDPKSNPGAKPANVSKPDKERTVAMKWTPPSSTTRQKPKS